MPIQSPPHGTCSERPPLPSPHPRLCHLTAPTAVGPRCQLNMSCCFLFVTGLDQLCISKAEHCTWNITTVMSIVENNGLSIGYRLKDPGKYEGPCGFHGLLTHPGRNCSIINLFLLSLLPAIKISLLQEGTDLEL